MSAIVGRNIKRLRNNAKLKQADLAGLLSVTNKAVSSWETGRTDPDCDTVKKLCKIFKCTIIDIMGDDGYAPEVLNLNREEQAILKAYKEADNAIKDAVAYILHVKREDTGLELSSKIG